MIKRFTVYTVPEGTDGDEFWKYHKGVHAKDVMDAVGHLRIRYAINRVNGILAGETKVFAFIETCWDSKEKMMQEPEILRTKKLSNGKTISEDWHSKIADSYSVTVEEYVVK